MPILGELSGAPSGTIGIWIGSEITIPQGWKHCNGLNGTPDLRNRFPRCVPNTSTNPGATGGTETETLTISQIPPHIHALNISNHTHDSHEQVEAPNGTITPNLVLTGNTSGRFEIDVASASLVTSISSTGGGAPHTNIPRCKNVIYIQKV